MIMPKAAIDPNKPILRALGRVVKNSKGYLYRILRKDLPGDRPELVVVGTGWASLNLIRQIDPTKYSVTVISPRAHFLFTPLLTCALSGTLNLRSITEPIRPFLLWGGRPAMKFVKAKAVDIDHQKNLVKCVDAEGLNLEVPYDKLALGVGCLTNTFNIPGVLEHSTFIKEVGDVKKIRDAIFKNYNQISQQASTSAAEAAARKKLLNVVVVGGGPAGLEAAAEVNDLMQGELKKHFQQDGTVTLIEMLSSVLPTFGPKIAQYTTENIRQQGIQTLVEHRVEKVDADNVYAVNVKTNKKVVIPYGHLIWASGVAQTDLTRKLMTELQPNNRVLKASPDMKVIGSNNIYGMGDCVMLEPPKLTEKLNEIAQGGMGGVGVKEPMRWIRSMRRSLLLQNYVQLHPRYWRPSNDANDKKLPALLAEIDASYKPPIPTAQMARQAGAYLGARLNRMAGVSNGGTSNFLKLYPYVPSDSGNMSYIGKYQAVLNFKLGRSMPKPIELIRLGGFGSNALWQGYYFISQYSLYNKFISAADLIRGRAATREMTEDV